MKDRPAPENTLTAEQRAALLGLIETAGFSGTLHAMARLAKQWSDHANVDIRHCSDLRALSLRLSKLAEDVQEGASFL